MAVGEHFSHQGHLRDLSLLWKIKMGRLTSCYIVFILICVEEYALMHGFNIMAMPIFAL